MFPSTSSVSFWVRSLTPGPLGSRLFQALHRYYEPLRLPLPAASALLPSAEALQLHPSPEWVSQVPGCSFSTRSPGFTPESPPTGFSHPSSRRCWLHTFWVAWPLSSLVSRLQVPVRFRCSSHFRSSEASANQSPDWLLGLLHVWWLFTWSTPFIWPEHPGLLGAPEGHEGRKELTLSMVPAAPSGIPLDWLASAKNLTRTIWYMKKECWALPLCVTEV